MAQLFGPTGGYLMAYPFVDAVTGWVYERGSRGFHRAALAGFAGEILLFAGGLSWLALWFHSVTQAVKYGLYWLVFAEVIKVLMAAGFAERWNKKLGARS